MKILVTGAHGQLGQSLVDLLSNEDCKACSHQDLDITNSQDVQRALEAFKPDFVINAAAYNQVDQAETDQKDAFNVNELGPKNLAQSCEKVGADFVHVSTDYVFDGTKKTPYAENDETNPLSVYAKSKLAGERATLENCSRSYAVRTAWVFHADGNNFYNRMIELKDREELKVTADQISSPTYAPHLAEGIVRLIQTKNYGLYHMAGKGETSRYEVTKRLFEALQIQTPLKPVPGSEFPSPAKRPQYSAMTTIKDPSLVLPDWQEGLEAFIFDLKKKSL